MHRRNSTKHLDRRKSTSSISSVHLEHIHPKTAERDAQAAATKAFARARERSATDATLWPPQRNNGSSGKSSYGGTPERCSHDSSLRRQQSVRFVRARSSRGTQIHTVVEDMTPAPKISTVKVRVTVNGLGPRSTSSASGAGMVSAAKGMAGDYINALLAGEEYYTPEDDIASAPSSYRKIRKSRSMFASSEASMSSKNFYQGPVSATTSQLASECPGPSKLDMEESIPATRLKAPKSMSFLRSRRDQPMLFSKRRGSIPIGGSSDGWNGVSTDKEGLKKSHSSAFPRSNPANIDRSLRKSMRDTSNDTLPMYGKIPKDGSLRNRARKVSHNVKHRLKSLFSLVKGENDEAMFPPQHIEASRSHIMDSDNKEFMKDDESQFEPTIDEGAISRVPSGIPSLHAVPSHQQLRSRKGSVESLASERRTSDDRSRVTSWTNSDTNTLNTLNSHRGEWERQRLSVIKENGMHVSSSSARPPNINSHATSTTTKVGSTQPPMPPQPATVNSQRIYSALMKKLRDTNKHSQTFEVQAQKSDDDYISVGAIPLRGSSRAQEIQKPIFPATIRHVVSDISSDTNSVGTVERKQAADPRKVETEHNDFPFHLNIESASEKDFSSSTSAVPTNEYRGSVDDQKTPAPPVRTLSTRSSAFFASPTCHLFRTRSPYRRAIQESIRTDSQTSGLKSPEFNPWMRSLTSLPIRCPSTCESEMDKKMHYAKSIYSTATEEAFTGSSTNTSTVMDRFPKPPHALGDATIFVDPPVYRPTPPIVPNHRVTSSASSVEWKTWLSANVSKLEGSPGCTDPGVLEYTVPSSRSSGHVREKAQISDEDESPQLEVYKPTGPDTMLATIGHTARAFPMGPRPTMQSSTSPSPHCDKENEAPDTSSANTSRRMLLRKTPSAVSMRSAQEEKAAQESTGRERGGFDSIRRKSLAHKSSANTLAGSNNPPSTRKLVKKQSGFRKYVTPTASPRDGGLMTAVDKQFRKTTIGGSNDSSKRKLELATPMKTENISPRQDMETIGDDGGEVDLDPYDVEGSGVLGPETDTGVGATPQSIGGKKMVDIFLSSRRRRMASGGGGDDGGVFV